MQTYFAPMEGITGYIFRNAFEEYYGGIDKYFTPFIPTHSKKSMSSREKNDIIPEHNKNMNIVPQIISKNAEDSVELIGRLNEEYGYEEINLNLGCPSGTVVAKGRGAGFLAYPEELDKYLEYVYSHINVKMSIKTRLGIEAPEEFNKILEIYNKYPLSELIIHPRVQKDFYNNEPNWEAYGQALRDSRCPVVYNGNIFNLEDYNKLCEAFPETVAVMVGRGALINPALPGQIKAGKEDGIRSLEVFKNYHTRLLQEYRQTLGGDTNVIFKMKELWFWFGQNLDGVDKPLKKLMKAKTISEYEIAVNNIYKCL